MKVMSHSTGNGTREPAEVDGIGACEPEEI